MQTLTGWVRRFGFSLAGVALHSVNKGHSPFIVGVGESWGGGNMEGAVVFVCLFRKLFSCLV